MARQVARRMSQRGKHVTSYRCDVCGLWHCGNPIKPPRFGKDGQRLRPSDPKHKRRRDGQ